MKIENWRLVSLNVNDEIIGLSVINQKYQEFGSYLAIAGNITGCPEVVRDGAFIRTSQIKQVNLEEGYVTTYSGLIYDLGSKHPDYRLYEQAMNNPDKLVLGEWRIIKEGWDTKLLARNMKNGEMHEGIVVKQNIYRHEIVFKDDTTAFVDWSRISMSQVLYYMMHPELRQFTKFISFCEIEKQEPVLL